MKAVLIEGYMETAHFNIPGWCGKVERTYPLPPFSTVIGMIHNMCEWKQYHAMDVSVAGKGRYNEDLELRWNGGAYAKTETEDFKKRYTVRVKGENGYTGWVHGPVYVNFLNDLILRLHVAPENESDLEAIYKSMLLPPIFPSLGKHEDIMRIDNVKIVEIIKEEKEIELTLDMYCQREEYSGTYYKIHKNYEIIKNRRIFNDKKVIVLSKGQKIVSESDSEGNPVLLI